MEIAATLLMFVVLWGALFSTCAKLPHFNNNTITEEQSTTPCKKKE